MKYPDYINKIIQGDALAVLKTLPSESVNCVVTSPPYWALRDYGVEGQLGLENTSEEYIYKLCDIFDEVKRVLRKDGTCWVNIGDTYWGGGNNRGSSPDNLSDKQYSNRGARGQVQNEWDNSYQAKSLCLIPFRFAIEMVNRGWILRNTIIWHKPNCMPSSVKDRFTVDFEYVFFFTKSNKTLFWVNEKTLECVDRKPPGINGIEGKDWEWQIVGDYEEKDIFNVRVRDATKANFLQGATEEEIRNYNKGKEKKVSLWTGHNYWFEQQFEAFSESYLNDNRPAGVIRQRLYPNSKYAKAEMIKLEHPAKVRDWQKGINKRGKDAIIKIHPGRGRNKRCVWAIPTKPFPEAHFAVYPEELIETPIKAGCPEFVCKKCGKARVKIIDNSERINTRPGKNVLNGKSEKDIDPHKGLHKADISIYGQKIIYKEVGYTDCGCNAGFEPGIVLDPFMGAGTTAVVSLKQGKRFIGIELNPDYIEIAKRRIEKVQPIINLIS